MINDVVTKIYEQNHNVLAKVIKANQLSAANLETLVHFQMSVLPAYVDFAISRLKAVTDIKDSASLISFMISQSEAMASLQQKFVDDAKTLGDLAARFNAEFDQLVRDSLSGMARESQSGVQSQSVGHPG